MAEHDPADLGGLSFEDDRARHRSVAIRSAWSAAFRIVITSLVVTLGVVMLSQAFYLLAEARGRHDAPAFPYSIPLDVRTGDPIVDELSQGYLRCIPPQASGGGEESDPDQGTLNDRCTVLRHLVNGEDASVVELARAWMAKRNRQQLDDPMWWLAGDVLAAGLNDAAERADWATCKRYSRLAFALFDVLDPQPSVWYPKANQALLLATLCDDAGAAFSRPEMTQFLGRRISSGRHLEDSTLEHLKLQANDARAAQWFALLSGIRLFRSGDLEKAAIALERAELAGSSALVDLLRHQQGRVVYWTFERDRELMGQLTMARRQAVLQQLDALMSKTARANLKSDLAEYRARLDIDPAR